MLTFKLKLRVKGNPTAKTLHLGCVVALGMIKEKDPYEGLSAPFLDLIRKAQNSDEWAQKVYKHALKSQNPFKNN